MKVKRRDFIKSCAAATGVIAMTAGNAAANTSAADAASGPMGELAAALLAPPIDGESKPATTVIAGINQALLDQLPFNDTTDYDDAAKNLVEGTKAVYLPPRAGISGCLGPFAVRLPENEGRRLGAGPTRGQPKLLAAGAGEPDQRPVLCRLGPR